jgi:hypothetical protein
MLSKNRAASWTALGWRVCTGGMRLIITVLAAGALAGCGGAAAEAPAISDDNAQDTARTKLEQCLREAGVQPPIKRTDPGLRAALDGPCADDAKAAFGSTNPTEDPAAQDALTKFRACLRGEGLEPDGPGSLDRSDPKVQAAIDACRDELPENLRR